MAWIYLLFAGFFEISWAIGLKYSNGFTVIFVSVITVICMIASFYFLALSVKTLPLGTAYAVWTGIGTIGTVILGIILFKEPVSVIRILCILLIVSGITGLKLVSNWFTQILYWHVQILWQIFFCCAVQNIPNVLTARC